MAVSYIFDTTYGTKQNPSGSTGAHRVIIGCLDTVGFAGSPELVLYDPGVSIQYQGDNDRFVKSVMGSTLSFSARIDDAQLAVWDTLLNKDEGKVFCLFFDDTTSGALPYWYGHLVIEDAAITISNEYHDIDLSFTDGLASLRGKEWVDDNDGSPYTGLRSLEFYLKEIVFKLPAFAGYVDYVENVASVANVPVFSEVGLPWPSAENPGDNTFYSWHVDDPIFKNLRVKAQTFDKPKRKVDRLRELSPRPDFFSTSDVLEDICKAFGAVAVMSGGYVNIVCRQELAFFRGENLYDTTYDLNRSTQSWTYTTSDSTYQNTSFDSTYKISKGAVRRRSMPYSQTLLIHEDGGSDNLVQYGYFDPRGAAESGGRTDIFTSNSQTLLNTGYRSDITYVFEDDNSPLDDLPLGVNEDHLKYPADPSEYMGFPEQTADDIEVFSGENIRLTLGGNVKFRHTEGTSGLPTPIAVNMWGGTMVVRIRLEFTTIDDVTYRLSRTVQTHVLSNGSVDYINIDAAVPGSASDRLYFRKLYNEIAWVAEGGDGYDDAWYEIMVPHGDTNNTGDDWGASIHPLTVKYAGQVPYAPLGTKILGEDDGTGVELQREVSDAHMFHYFREDIQLELPYGSSDEVLNFETARFEMGAQIYESDNGPRPNTTAQNNGSPEYDGETPVWRSANADGTGGSKLYSTGSYFMAEPYHIQFVGARVALGDGSDTADITTKFTGGDGYEVFDIGSSRIGSRLTFYNKHNAGTVYAPIKTSNNAGAFLQSAGQTVYSENLKWFGHYNTEPDYGDDGDYDALHSYVAHSHLQLLGRSADVYSMSMLPHPGSNVSTLMTPFLVSNTSQFTVSGSIYLMPLNLRWTPGGGLSGEFLKVGAARDLGTVQEIFDDPRKGAGPIGGQPGHGIVGLIDQVQQSRVDTSTNTTDITNLDSDLTSAKDDLEAQSFFLER